jgi:hypothetical protein
MNNYTKKLLSAVLMLTLGAMPAFADYKITQRTTMEDVSTEYTVYAKGVRERRESRMIMEGMSADEQAMMAKMMPASLVEITQCDLKQNVSVNESKKAYFVDYYDWSGLSPEQQKRRPNQKAVVKGASTVSSVVTDSGKRQQMFGMTARWVKAVQSVENSADSCDGKASIRIEREGWFVDLSLNRETCPVPQIAGGRGGCRPKLILKGVQDPGFFLEGTTKMYADNKLQSTSNLKTTALSKATLDQSLFEIPAGYKEVDALNELMGANGDADNTAKTVYGDADNQTAKTKTIAIDFFSGNVSKINQDELRGYISSRLTSAGFSGFPVNSQAEIASGNFANVIGVEIKKLKESGASKIGGLFGKVTGSEDAAKVGDSEAEIVITIYGKDGKTVVATANASEKTKGKASDAVKAAIDKILDGLLSQIK